MSGHVGSTMIYIPSTDQKELAGRCGWLCIVLRELDGMEKDRHAIGPMFEVEFQHDAQRFYVFDEELIEFQEEVNNPPRREE